MWVDEKLIKNKAVKFIERGGNVTRVLLPKNNTLTSLYTMEICKKKQQIEFKAGESIFALATKFGVSSESEFTFLFVNGGVLFDLHWGSLFFESPTGIYEVTDKNEVKEYTGNASDIYWKTAEEFKKYMCMIVESHYHLKNQTDVTNYLKNLIFTGLSSYNSVDKLYSFKTLDFYGDLGLEEFSFDIQTPDETPITLLPLRIDEDEIIEPKNVTVVKKDTRNKTCLSDCEDEEDDDTLEIDVLPGHMHEVDIFSEYVSDEDLAED